MARARIDSLCNTPRRAARRLAAAVALPLAALAMAGCERNDMHNQPKHEPQEPSAFFVDGQSSRPTVAGTVARGQNVPNDLRYAGLAEGQPADVYPFEVTKADLMRGQQRFNIYCAVCHGVDGDGNGMVVQRGFTKPPSLHDQRLKDAPAGHFFNVITNGWGAMYSYNDRVFPEDRWRIAAYIRVLQLSQQDAVASAAGAQPGGGGMQGAPQQDSAVQDAVNRVLGGGSNAQPQQQQDPQPQQPPTGVEPEPRGGKQ